MKKSLRSLIILSISLLLVSMLTSCEYYSSSGTDRDLETLTVLNANLTSVMTLLASDLDIENRSLNLSLSEEPQIEEDQARSLNPSAGDIPSISTDVYDYLHDDSGTILTPAQVYTLYESGNSAYVPGKPNKKVLITNFYGDEGLEAYFKMTKKGTTEYYIELFIYDHSNLYLKYEYEKYLVKADDTSWAFYEENGVDKGFISLESVYYDKSYVEKEVLDASYTYADSADAQTVYTITTPAITAANENLYTYTITDHWDNSAVTLENDATDLDPPARTRTGGDYFVQTYGTGNVTQDNNGFGDFQVKTYYAEYNNQNNRDAVSYILQPIMTKKGKTQSDNWFRTVVRSQAVYADNSLQSKNINSLKVSSWRNDNPYQYETQEIVIGLKNTSSNLLTYSQVDKIYSNSLSANPWKHTIMELDEINATGTNVKYSGTYRVIYTGGSSDNYSVSYKNGVLKMSYTGWTRGFFGPDISLDLSQIQEDGSFSINLPAGGLFTGQYDSGVLVGYFTERGSTPKEIRIFSGSVYLDGELVE